MTTTLCFCGCGADATRGLYMMTRTGLRMVVDEDHAKRAALPVPLRCYPVPLPAARKESP